MIRSLTLLMSYYMSLMLEIHLVPDVDRLKNTWKRRLHTSTLFSYWTSAILSLPVLLYVPCFLYSFTLCPLQNPIDSCQGSCVHLWMYQSRITCYNNGRSNLSRSSLLHRFGGGGSPAPLPFWEKPLIGSGVFRSELSLGLYFSGCIIPASALSYDSHMC